jgi:type IV pilus assembly protein PilB
LDRYYRHRDPQERSGYEHGIDDVLQVLQPPKNTERPPDDLLDLVELPPVIRFTNSVFVDAINLNASDIHIEPQLSKLLIRCRVDGIMQEMLTTDKHVHAPLVSRIKIISGMDIAERFRPQDGKAQIRYGKKIYDLRVSTIPTTYGEKVTIRVLDPDTAHLTPKDLGLSAADLAHVADVLDRPQGIILVTGPTGSGKSSTLYAFINHLNTPQVNIVTVEDPVEFAIDGINQMQIKPKAGLTFAYGLRSILRQDPDIVMVGEIRDAETAAIACQAGQTGHRVLSTLHTNDAPSAVTRLMDLGIDDFQLADVLLAVIGQRLVRKICRHCKIKAVAPPQMLERVRHMVAEGTAPVFWKGAGCENCRQSGYAGRLGIFEILVVSPAVRQRIRSGVTAGLIRQAAGKEGFRTMTSDGLDKAFQGLTTLEEVLRAAPPEIGPDEFVPAAPLDVPSAKRSGSALAAATITDEPLPFSNAPVAAHVPRVLVVDDSAVVRKMTRNLLEAEDFVVFTAENGADGLDAARRHRPDLIVTDVMMPAMDGVALVRALKSDPEIRSIPVVMLSANDRVDMEVAGIDAGADDYLGKPVDPKRFVARLRRLLP